MALRCFIAVELPEALKVSLGALIEGLKKSGADVKWVAPENIHITVKFLGSTGEDLIGPIREALERKLSGYTPFVIDIAGLGCFPGERRPRVVWVGVHEPGVMKDLQRDVETAMAEFGFSPEERAFSPHITIGRVKSQSRISEMMKRLKEYGTAAFGGLEVTGVSLMKSELKPAGAQYDRLAEISFGGRI